MENKNWIELSKIVGEKQAKSIRKVLGGEIVYIPRRDANRINKEIEKLHKQNLNPIEISCKLKCSKRYVFLVIEKYRKSTNPYVSPI